MMKKVIKKLARKSPSKSSSGSTRSKSAGSMDISQEELSSLIQKKAFELYEKRGYTHGDDQADWYKAEKSVRTSLKKKK